MQTGPGQERRQAGGAASSTKNSATAPWEAGIGRLSESNFEDPSRDSSANNASLHAVPPAAQQCKYVLVVDQRDGKALDNAFVNVLNKEGKAVEQQYLVSRNSQGKLVLRELPLLKRGAVFCSASVIQHADHKAKLIFLFTSTRADLQGAYVFRVVSQGFFVDSELVPSPAPSVSDVFRPGGKPNNDPKPAPPRISHSNEAKEEIVEQETYKRSPSEDVDVQATKKPRHVDESTANQYLET